MGCGSSGNVVPVEANGTANGNSKANGANGHHDDGLPTVVLPETPVKPKPPIAFEIPLEEFDAHQRTETPPPHLQRLLQPPQQEISLPDIEEKLAEAEQRRQQILQQRAASAQKKAQRMTRSFKEMDGLDSEHEIMDSIKHASNTLTIPPDPGLVEDKNIS
ncbi:uncharacterized protein LOC125229683 [Leguminivora glycinivorella]|uniref:uncharacterized protein LOC125229683 n=1 Tax=Leguminivora glycinivorella TaxID=1035111 RepID=UPI00200C1CA6|nr:uncharacterized protein LOC125229683 [Leguminivora glycinivorella]